MEFGEWVQDIRKQQALDVRAFAEKVGIDPSTVSRIENLRTQATLYTAFKICEAMDYSLADLVNVLTGQRPSFSYSYQQSLPGFELVTPEDVVTLQDVENVIQEYNKKTQYVGDQITDGLNSILDFIKEKSFYPTFKGIHKFDYREIDRFLFETPLYKPTVLEYPPEIPPTSILDIFLNKGALILNDVELYINAFRVKAFFPTFPSKAISPNFPSNALSLGTSLERIRLSDVLSTDEKMGQNGIVSAMYWEACRFNEHFSSVYQRSKLGGQLSLPHFSSGVIVHEEWEIRLATMYLLMCRWFQYMQGGKPRRYRI